jgi:replication-associated recombination protein RarA
MNAQATMQFASTLTQKYKPQAIGDFIGLEKQKKILAKLAANPRPMNLLFVGKPGTGKTSLAFAFAAAINAEVHHIGSQECKVENLQDVVRMCQYVPLSGGLHAIIIDEADVMSDASQKYLLSRMDGSQPIPNTILILTCNGTERLENRFTSRCVELPEFNSYGSGDDIVALMERVWIAEAGGAPMPNLKRLACGNVRESLNKLEVELLAA